MSDDKKDLTRIEDLGEFIHELNSENSFEEEIKENQGEEELFSSNEFSSDFSGDQIQSFESTDDSETSFSEFSNEDSDDSIPVFNPGEENSFSDNSSDFLNQSESESESESDSDNKPEDEAMEMSEDFESETFPTHDTSSETIESPPFDESIPNEVFESELSEITPPIENTDPTPPTDIKAVQEEQFKLPESFEDVKKFSESSNFSGSLTEANPSFSVLIKNVRYLEDVEDIVLILKEFNLLVDSEDVTKSRLMRGNLLIPRISEYAAIFISHKLRRFDIDLLVGLSDEIHPPKHQEDPEIGIVSKHNLFQNQTHHFHFDKPHIEISQILLATTPTLEGHQIIRYLGIATEHKVLDGYVVENENSDEIPQHYQELALKLKAHAIKLNSNAIVGLNYQLTPLPNDYSVGGNKYKLTCTGNLVWVNKI